MAVCVEFKNCANSSLIVSIIPLCSYSGNSYLYKKAVVPTLRTTTHTFVSNYLAPLSCFLLTAYLCSSIACSLCLAVLTADCTTTVEFFVKDGDQVKAGDLMAKVHGDIRVLLCGENFSDGVLLKDNHIGAAGDVKEAVKMAKAYAPFVRKIEVEVETFKMVQDAVEAGADIIMLDNMDNDLLKQSIDYIAGRAEIEISGNITKENIEKIKNFGVNYVSSGALTHSAPIMDISLKNLHAV